jgi:tRNA(Ile)-lysidine synthase
MVISRPDGLLMLPASESWGRPGPRFEYPLPVPGTVDIREVGATVVASCETAAPADALHAASGRVALQASAVELPLKVRNRRPGDRFRPLGAPGRRKVQDLLVDRKVPRQDRDRIPIVVDRLERVVWVAGVAVADRCRVTAPETGVVILEMRKNP